MSELGKTISGGRIGFTILAVLIFGSSALFASIGLEGMKSIADFMDRNSIYFDIFGVLFYVVVIWFWNDIARYTGKLMKDEQVETVILERWHTFALVAIMFEIMRFFR